MKKRLKKKKYKAILQAKEMMDTWNGDIYKAILVGYISPARKTRLGQAIRSVMDAGDGLAEVTHGWEFMMPSTSHVMISPCPYTIRLYTDTDYSEHVELDLRKITNEEYIQDVLKNERYPSMVIHFMGELVDAIKRM